MRFFAFMQFCNRVGREVVMKNRLAGRFAILALSLSGALSIGALAQTTEEGPGPSEQPSAPMEIGQGQGPDSQPQGQGPDSQPYDDSNAQPTEAQPGGPSGEAPAATDQGVGRISLIHGDVSTQRGDSGDWSAAALNQALMTGDKISTGDNARSEVQLDFANTLRLSSNTKANVATLTKKNIQIQLGEGLKLHRLEGQRGGARDRYSECLYPSIASRWCDSYRSASRWRHNSDCAQRRSADRDTAGKHRSTQRRDGNDSWQR